MRKSYIFLGLILILAAICYIGPVLFRGSFMDPNVSLLNWSLITLIIVVLALLAFMYEFEESAAGAKEIALISMLGTISALVRLPFAALMNFQPSTFFIICTGYVFGPSAGFMVAALTAIISNLFLGQGPWTAYQILTWGLIGMSAGFIRRIPIASTRIRIGVLIVFGIIWGYLYGVIINVWYWVYFVYPLTWKTYLVTLLNAVWWDTTHALANAFFMFIFGTRTLSIMQRFKNRFFWSRETAADQATGTAPMAEPAEASK